MSEKSNSISIDYRVRRGAISAYGRALSSSRILCWVLVCFGVVCGIIILGLLVTLPSATPALVKAGLIVALALMISGYAIAWHLTNRNFIEPDLAFRKWLQQVCDGNLDARIDLPSSHQHYKELHFHTRNLAQSLMQLSTDMENLVDVQTHTLEQQKQALGLLFQLTADVAQETDKKQVLKLVSKRLADWLGNAKVYGYLSNDHQLECVTAITAGSQAASSQAVNSPAELTLGGFIELHAAGNTISVSEPGNSSGSCTIRIPFFSGRAIAGLLLIHCDEMEAKTLQESDRIFKTVSEQLSMFMTKQQVAQQAYSAQRVKERSALAAEIHDSLAQTLLATRNQLTLLKDKAQPDDSSDWIDDVSSIENSIAVANSEVRNLIHEYRKPLHGRSSVDVLRDAIDKFKQSSGMEVFLQCDAPSMQFNHKEDTVIQRIVGEALVNSQKYASADMIRVYLQSELNGIRSILIEDDGVGFSVLENHGPGMSATPIDDTEHYGIQIMHELALSIGAVLEVESEPGEGTRVLLKMPPSLVQ